MIGIFSEIEKTTDEAHDLVKETYSVIEMVKKYFDVINDDVENLVASSEQSTATILSIIQNIGVQNETVKSINSEILEIANQSRLLQEHY